MKAVRNLLIYIFSTYLLVMFGFNGAQDFWCSTLVKGVIYGSYSVSEMFPKNFTNCTWTLENPDPTKYSIYLKFSKKDFSCSNFSLLAYQFDHFSHEKIKDLLKNNHSIMQLCDSKNAFVFLQYDKNFIQIRRVYPFDFLGLYKREDDQKSFFEFLVLNKVSPSQFGCRVLCTWLESCLKSENGRTESCGIMYTKCTCPQHLGEWGGDDHSLVLLNNVVLPLNEQTEGCLTQELQTTQVCNLTREAKRPPKEDVNELDELDVNFDHVQPGYMDPAGNVFSNLFHCALSVRNCDSQVLLREPTNGTGAKRSVVQLQVQLALRRVSSLGVQKMHSSSFVTYLTPSKPS
ncbi:hypothetical protein JRQ81_005665 [Phrynocephalus forsythii]|uniref:Adhesion G protein-coupled receptor B N-terminal domain-containing protein n=1 Tax=Phrynocephalus forsythii TaxID=171643 RepID=A0A9Q0Y313_9SAUR|nr:hypothetical protein JRQ81_005665 [Phrynocephalus forsythii]